MSHTIETRPLNVELVASILQAITQVPKEERIDALAAALAIASKERGLNERAVLTIVAAAYGKIEQHRRQ